VILSGLRVCLVGLWAEVVGWEFWRGENASDGGFQSAGAAPERECGSVAGGARHAGSGVRGDMDRALCDELGVERCIP
jgi:hypothetical protein